LAKVTLELESETAGAIPVPDKPTVCGLPLALSAKLNEALRLPAADGVKVTLTVQVLFGVTVAPVQVSALLAKSPAFAPPTAAAEMVRFAVPLLVTITVCAALVVLTSRLAKVTLGMESETMGAIPVPARPTACGLPVALSVKINEPLRLPIADGVKVTLTAQVLFGVTVAPVQVSALLVKSPAFVPPRAAVAVVRFPVPVLVTVTLCAALVVLTS
jgi:hypothetical protein